MDLSQPAKYYLRYLIWLVAALLAWRFYIVLRDFNTMVTDNDQVMFWMACDDMSRGLFYTPFTYGCGYGNLLESLLAVPFYAFGMPLYYALPVSNGFWTFLLILLIGFNLNRRYPDRQAGTVFVFLMGCMPTEYYAILFTGKALLGGILMLLTALAIMSRSTSPKALILAGLIAGIGVQFNPNSLFLLFIIGYFITDKRQVIYLVSGLLCSLGYYAITSYYVQFLDSEYLHKQWLIEFTFSNLKSHIGHIDHYLNTMTPVFHNRGFIGILLPFILAVNLFTKKKWLQGSALLALALGLFFSFGINKISDGSEDILFPINRFYLGVAFCTTMVAALLFGLIRAKYALFLPALAPVLMVFYINKTSAEAMDMAGYAGGNTYAVRKSTVADLEKHRAWCVKKVNEIRRDNRIILVSDGNFFSENMYLRTKRIPGLVNCSENYRAFYWMDRKMRASDSVADLLFIIKYDKTLERKMKQYPQYLYRDSTNHYFLVRDVQKPREYIDSFLK